MKREIIEKVKIRKEKKYRSFVKKHYPKIFSEIDTFPGKDFTQKFYNFLYDLDEIPICPVCNKNEVSFYRFVYAQCCSPKCGNSYPGVSNKTKQTMLERYGSECYLNSTIGMLTIEKNNLEKYGVKHAQSSQIVKDKIKQSNLEKYGVENVSQIQEVKDTIKRNNLEKYGVENVSQIQEVKDSRIKTLIENGYILEDKYTAKWTDKIRKTSVENGTWFDYNDIRLYERFKKYKRRVLYLTNKLDLAELFGNCSVNRKESKLHIDHIYSIKDGFLNNIPPEIISNANNLQILPEKENISKGARSDITINKLYELISVQEKIIQDGIFLNNL